MSVLYTDTDSTTELWQIFQSSSGVTAGVLLKYPSMFSVRKARAKWGKLGPPIISISAGPRDSNFPLDVQFSPVQAPVFTPLSLILSPLLSDGSKTKL